MNEPCEICGGNLWNFDTCMSCAFIALGEAFTEMLEPLRGALAELENIPDEKQIARQRSRDDLNKKRRQLRNNR